MQMPPESRQPILVASSLRPESDALITTALAQARVSGRMLHLVHAFPSLEDRLEPFATIEDPDRELRVAKSGELDEQLHRLGVARGELAGVTVEPGPVHRVLVEAGRRVQAAWVVVGASETGGPRRLGSTTDRLLRISDRPVLVVRGAPAPPISRTLVAIDLSPLSPMVLRQGLVFAAEASGSAPPAVRVLFVLGRAQRESVTQFEPGQIDRFAREEVRRLVERVAGDRAAHVQIAVRTGPVREEILAEETEWGADLLVLGTHGLGGSQRRPEVGNVTESVARRAAGSLLVVPTESARRARESVEGRIQESGDWTYVSDTDPVTVG